MTRATRGRRDETGASGVEYGLLVAGIAALIVAVVFLFGGYVTGIFDDSCDTVRAEVEGTCDPGAGGAGGSGD